MLPEPKKFVIFDKGLAPRPEFIKQFDNATRPGVPYLNLHKWNFARNMDDFIFCLCTRAIPEKGWEEAIKATLEINALQHEMRKGKQAHLRLIGDGEYKQTLRGDSTGMRKSNL